MDYTAEMHLPAEVAQAQCILLFMYYVEYLCACQEPLRVPFRTVVDSG